METRKHKRLLKSTLPTQVSIKAELQVCKLIISSELSAIIPSNIQQNKSLKQKLVNLQWQHTKQTSKDEKLSKQSRYLQEQKQKNNPQQIDRLKCEIQKKRKESQTMKKKIMDRKQSLHEDHKYWNKLKKQNEQLKADIERVNYEKDSILMRKEKLVFLVKEIVRDQSINGKSYQALNKQKMEIKYKLVDKINTGKSQLNDLLIKSKQTTQRYKSQQAQQRQMIEKIQEYERRQIQLKQEKEKNEIEINRMTRDLEEGKNYRYELNQRLRIERQRLSKQISRCQLLRNSKENLEEATRQYQESNQYILNEIKKLEYHFGFQIQHAAKLVSGA